MRIEYLGPDEKDESDDCAILTTGQKEFEIHIIETRLNSLRKHVLRSINSFICGNIRVIPVLIWVFVILACRCKTLSFE